MGSYLIRSLNHYRSPDFKEELAHWGTSRERSIYQKITLY